MEGTRKSRHANWWHAKVEIITGDAKRLKKAGRSLQIGTCKSNLSDSKSDFSFR